MYKRSRVWKHLALSPITGNGYACDLPGNSLYQVLVLCGALGSCTCYIDNLPNFTNKPVVYVFLPILQMEKLRHTVVKDMPRVTQN